MFDLMPFGHRENVFDVDRWFRTVGSPFPNQLDFKTDILDEGDHYRMIAELPGFQKEDIHLDVENGRITISAQHEENQEQKGDDGCYVRRERRYGAFSRSFDLTGIDEQAIRADYKNGVLELTLPKQAPQNTPQRRQITIQ